MKLNRQAIQRMINAGDLNIGGRRGGGSGAGGGGGVSAAWVEQNYISKAFFARIFKIWVGYGSSKVEIEPNDEMPTPDTSVNIQAVYGLWTEKFLTALGEGTGGGGGGGGASTLAELNDVTLTNPQNGNLLQYNGTHWVNVTLATLMTDYATKQWCNSTFATIASLADNATQSWVNQQGFIKTHPTSFWGQNWPPTNSAISGDMTSVGDITFSDGNRKLKFDSSDNFNIRKISDRFIIKSNGTEVINIYNNQLYCATQIRTTVGLLSDDYVTALSDIRYKDVVRKFSLNIDDIAGASLILFT